MDTLYSDDCKAAMIVEFDCKKEFTCPDYEAFEADPGADEHCADAYHDKVVACGLSETTPEECTAYCLTAETCQPSSIGPSCADECNMELGRLEHGGGATCSEGGLAVYACLASLSCPSLNPWIFETGPAVGCEDVFSGISTCP
jgi:hypothetical protein